MKIKDVFLKLKELWKIPKFKGLIQLLFWVIFFLIVSLLFRSAEKKVDLPVDINNKIDSYEYNYQYKESNNIINISGTYYQDKQVFYMNDIKYYYLDNNYYLAVNKELTNMPYAMNEWEYESLKNIMDNNSYSNKIEYIDSTLYEYNIGISAYNNYYNTNYPNNIVITIVRKDDKIESASINYGFGKVEINYSNINKIKNLDISID